MFQHQGSIEQQRLLPHRSFWSIVLIAALIAAIPVGCAPHVQPPSPMAPLPMSASDAAKVMDIAKAVDKGGKLSETDTDWLLSIVGDLPPDNPPRTVQRRAAMAAGVFNVASIDQLPASRIPRIYDVAAKMAGASGPGLNRNYTWDGLMILGNLRDPKAAPLIRLHLTSGDPTTRKFAEKALAKLNAT